MTSRFELPGDIAARMKMLAELHRQCAAAETEQDSLAETGHSETAVYSATQDMAE